MKYKTGFTYNGMLFGIYERELYRLPQVLNKRFLPRKLMKLRKEKIGGGDWVGYQLRGRRKSLTQIRSMLRTINFSHEWVEDSDYPF